MRTRVEIYEKQPDGSTKVVETLFVDLQEPPRSQFEKLLTAMLKRALLTDTDVEEITR